MLKYKKIVLVDDDIDDRQIFAEILGEMAPDLLIETAENGLELIALLDKTSDDDLPDMIILDQNMPRMSGKESLIFLKKDPRYRAIPIIVYSTYQIEDFYQECLGLGAWEVVEKPDSMQAYRDMIGQFILSPSPTSAPHTHPSKP